MEFHLLISRPSFHHLLPSSGSVVWRSCQSWQFELQTMSPEHGLRDDHHVSIRQDMEVQDIGHLAISSQIICILSCKEWE
eukprot:s363_g6.t1